MVSLAAVYFHFRAHVKIVEISSPVGSVRPRMTLEFLVRVSGIMMRSYFLKGKKQKFGSTLSTVIDVCITLAIFFFSLDLVPLKKIHISYVNLTFQLTVPIVNLLNNIC